MDVLRESPIIAYRWWGTWKLRSEYGTGMGGAGLSTIWTPGVATAHCKYFFQHMDRPAPQPECSCGIWAIRDFQSLPCFTNCFCGMVALWGKVIVQNWPIKDYNTQCKPSLVYRAQYAKPVRFFKKHPRKSCLCARIIKAKDIKKIATLYGVKVKTMKTLLRHPSRLA